MGANTDLGNELQILQRRWDEITDEPELARSTMDVIEYGLGKRRRAEVYVNRLGVRRDGVETVLVSACLSMIPSSGM